MRRPTIPDVLGRFKTYYDRVGDSWGSLHIVLADGNEDNSHVEFCIRHAMEHGDSEAAELGRVLLTMTKTQRLKLPRAVYRLSDPPAG